MFALSKMKSIIFFLFCINLLFSNIVGYSTKREQSINSGPMVGYSTKREVALWIQTTASKKVRFNYWEKDNPNKNNKTLTTDEIITDNSRILAIKSSIQNLISKKNKIFIIAHFGRPKGKVLEKYSLDLYILFY